MIKITKMVINCDDCGNSSEWVSLGDTDESEDYKDKCDCDSTDG